MMRTETFDTGDIVRRDFFVREAVKDGKICGERLGWMVGIKSHIEDVYIDVVLRTDLVVNEKCYAKRYRSVDTTDGFACFNKYRLPGDPRKWILTDEVRPSAEDLVNYEVMRKTMKFAE